jgi:DivIVA domain-containing protein
MRKKDTTSEDAAAWASAPGGRITPQEVQQKEFRVARFGAGYRMREVDEFLDQVTDAMSALVAENERLLEGSARESSASSRPSTPPSVLSPAVPSPADDAGRAAVDAFLRREKGFLQDLGGLVQAHAEELRSMVRGVRRDIGAPVAAAPPIATEPPVAVAPMKESPMEPPAAVTEVEPAPDATPEPTPDPPTVADEPHDEIEDEMQEDDPEASGGPPTTTGVVAEEPIRLDEPEPARSGRSEEEEEGSLRELFWGEE